MLLDSVDSLEDFNNRTILPQTFSMGQQIIVNIENGIFDEIMQLNTRRSNSTQYAITQYEYFLIEEKDSVKLLTFTAFLPEECRQEKLVEVNSFNMTTRKWRHERFWIDKVANLHGCKIEVLVEFGLPEFAPVTIDHEKENVTECVGYVCTALKEMSSALNFTYRTNMYYGSKLTFPKKSIYWHLQYRVLNAAHIFRNDPRYKRVIFARPVNFKEHFIAIPPGDEFDGYEKLILPFDRPTWAWIAVTFVSAFVAIFALRFVNPEIKIFVIGRCTKNPMLNVIRAFFGISQTICPGKNFARYLLMMFILFSLVIRTAYQGVMFTFLQQEIRKPTVTSTDEMIDQNFTFYMPNGFKIFFQDMDIAKRFENNKKKSNLMRRHF